MTKRHHELLILSNATTDYLLALAAKLGYKNINDLLTAAMQGKVEIKAK